MSDFRHLTTFQAAGLRRVGDVLIPGVGELPSFSQSGSMQHADRFLESLNDSDRGGLTFLLGFMRFCPRWLIRGLFRFLDRFRETPGATGAAVRMVLVGLKGLVMTLYYSDIGGDASIHRLIGWDARVGEPRGEVAEQSVAPVVRMLPKPAPRWAGDSPAVEAFARARAGALSLRALPLAERLRLLGDLRRIVLRRREEIVDRIQQDTGKTRSDALISEVYGVLENIAWLEKHAARHLAPSRVHTPLALLGKKSRIWYEPLGTILVISPWNYPFYQAVVPIALAFAAGNTVVYKPSEWTPLEGLVEDLLAEASFAPNWVRVVYGDGRAGAALVDQKPDRIFFTGSTRTGRKILEQAAPHLIPVELELGGKDAMIVFADANLDRAAAGAAWGAFTCTGQSCTSVERLYVQESIYDDFKRALIEQAKRIKQIVDTDGDGDIGRMTTDFQVKIVARQVEDARSKGAKILTGTEWDGESSMIPPIVLDEVTPEMTVATEETFGPVLPLFRFRHEDEVVRLANDSPYGLTASVWSKDLVRAERIAHALQVGGVSINNVMLTEANPALPFGGLKNSGFGRYKGAHGLHAFSNVKSVLIDKDSRKIEANWYPYTRKKYELFSDLTVNQFAGGWRSFARFVRTGLKLERYSGKAARQDVRRERRR